MGTVRAKFTVSKVTRNFYSGREQPGMTIVLTPQYDTSIEEDRRYSKATPSGEISLYVDNPTASDALIAGQVFYVDFTPVPKPEPVGA
jgi:hypothetical protein